MANLATGGTLPGLSIAQDVSHFQNTVQTFRSIDDARKKQEEIKMKEEKEKIEKGISQPPEIETKLSSKGNG
ncbi:hypothetical protein A2625_01955 [candidate division WOR-1 bacterium RIFCSPHIGHO2_01_FULL_53_15]|uniref:Uncharacterized protein n=1 Tax=candidate division WOR-1 bacterium RIFCSPHIGHO2_01_FULL_53_15 TaxID=1802564 RepID=A0A1F4Q2H2_UNCSA|nr:MAG: hypothetical protein A2625_01955 [candidate division WOR-1 bacterium RIFCSPHIGHO2_01_FULL_53_15]OGC13587.1 MAG: hypothetical protein A3D23_06050 [candidate division WOR-1 bacterium RIFCSPHIGHO2_02_FULL_53_26]